MSLWRSKMPFTELEQSQIVSQSEISDLIAADAFPQAIAQMAQSFVNVHGMSPRTAGLFATQQRWLLCHAILAYHFRKGQFGQSALNRSIQVASSVEPESIRDRRSAQRKARSSPPR